MPVRTFATLISVIVLLFSALSAHAEIYSFASTNSSSSHPPPSTSNIAGERVASTASADFGYTSRTGEYVYTGTITGGSSAATDHGVNRLGIASGLSYYSGPNKEAGIPAYIYSNAQSLWSDEWIFSGGMVGDHINGVIYGHTSFGLALSGPLELGPSSGQFIVEQTLQLVESNNNFSLHLETADFLAAANSTPSGIDWHLAFTARSGFTMGVMSNFLAQSTYCGITDPAGTTCGISFQSGNSLVMDRIAIDSGYWVSSSSGQLIADGNGFAYMASIAENAVDNTIPEPGALALMALALMCSVYVRRRYCIL